MRQWKHDQMFRLRGAFVSLLAVGALLSCAGPSSIEATKMVPRGIQRASISASGFASNIGVSSVTGIGTTGGLGMPEVHPAEFKKAIELSLSSAGYLADSLMKADFVLDAVIIEVVMRDAGPTFHVDGLVRYRLTPKVGDPILQKIVRSETLATVGEVFAGGRTYLERVMMSSISQILDEIQALEATSKEHEVQ
jgi:hypothetical protein